MAHQGMRQEGRSVVVSRGGREERHEFSSALEAEKRLAFVGEAMSWIGTPFGDQGDVKGPNGVVDCAMLMVRSTVDTGLLQPFDPRPYAPRWAMHRSEEKFLGWVQDRIGAREVPQPRFGDIGVWMFGRCYSHGGIVINSEEIVHAYYAAGMCLPSRMDEPLLREIPAGRHAIPRPVKFFSLWGSD